MNKFRVNPESQGRNGGKGLLGFFRSKGTVVPQGGNGETDEGCVNPTQEYEASSPMVEKQRTTGQLAMKQSIIHPFPMTKSNHAHSPNASFLKSAARMRRTSSIRYSLTAKEEIRNIVEGAIEVSEDMRRLLEHYTSGVQDKVTELTLSDHGFKDPDLVGIALLLNVLHNTQKLDLSLNSFTFAEDCTYSKSLPRKHSQVRELDLSHNAMGKVTKLFRGFLTCFQNLETLNLSHCQLRDVDFHVLTLHFLGLRRLKVLRVTHNYMTDYGVLGIAKILEECDSIVEIDISNNSLTPKCWSNLHKYRAKVISDVPDSCRCSLM